MNSVATVAPKKLKAAHFVNQRTLIVGEVNAGKTTLTRAILEAFCRNGLDGRIVILDFAPAIPEQVGLNGFLSNVGGRLGSPANSRVIVLMDQFHAPRISSRTEEEALRLAQENVSIANRLLDSYARLDRDILFINDVSIYFQAGSLTGFVSRIRKAQTLVCNGYLGCKLGQGSLSQEEQRRMLLFQNFFDRIIRL